VEPLPPRRGVPSGERPTHIYFVSNLRRQQASRNATLDTIIVPDAAAVGDIFAQAVKASVSKSASQTGKADQ